MSVNFGSNFRMFPISIVMKSKLNKSQESILSLAITLKRLYLKLNITKDYLKFLGEPAHVLSLKTLKFCMFTVKNTLVT